MAKQKKQRYDGVVYSTADDFDYQNPEETPDVETQPNEKQRLRVLLDKKARKGKIVTLVEGFVGKEEDLENLAKTLKQKCGVGGSAKDGEILIQGDFKGKIFDILIQMGYKAKSIG
ncbi:translation initiation factor [Sphingobacterium olei]|uniref:Translation initiation factor n=1 Tax=Sphingobacterium olei TaxID=2571155 RepID=A0A4U0NYB5_9SPHI|nr:translation initiation factor [Sphingobacterium olei]TJZ59779.1 translation initiation factor [Sphingobacterium olei]